MLWGEVIVLRDEVEIQPYVTVVKQLRGAKDRSAGAVETSLGEPNQLSLRKTKAGEVGNIALYMAGIFYRKTDSEKALSLLRRISPPTSESLVGQGYVFENRGDWSEAQRMYEQAIEIDPNHAPACANMGNVFYRQRKYDEALTWYKKAIEIDPSFAPAYLNTGLVYYYQGKYDEALTWHKKAIEIDPSHAPAYSHMGFIYFTQGKYDEALKSSNKAVQIDSTDAAAYLTMGLVYSAQGKYDEALAYSKEAIGRDSTMVAAFDALGRVYMTQGKYRDAVAPLRKAIQLVPDYTYYSLWYFISLHGAGAREEARLHIQERAHAVEGDAWVIPVVRFYAGNVTEDAVLEKAQAEDPREDKGMKCEAYAYIGMAHLVGALAPADTAKAVDYFQRCVQTGVTDYVEYEFAKRAVERLTTR
jgi:tetratricopeptide (TPR) repeat protein